MSRSCNRCGVAYETLHTCAHPLHVALDPLCVYAVPPLPPTALACDICRPARIILDEGFGS